MATGKYLLCPECSQPMLPPGVEKKPNQYDHASGCPIEKIERLRRENADEFKRSEEIKTFLGPLCGLALAEDSSRIATWTWWQGVERSFEILKARLAAAEADTRRLDRLGKWFTNANWLHIHNCFMVEKPLREAVDYFAAIEDKNAARGDRP